MANVDGWHWDMNWLVITGIIWTWAVVMTVCTVVRWYMYICMYACVCVCEIKKKGLVQKLTLCTFIHSFNPSFTNLSVHFSLLNECAVLCCAVLCYTEVQCTVCILYCTLLIHSLIRNRNHSQTQQWFGFVCLTFLSFEWINRLYLYSNLLNQNQNQTIQRTEVTQQYKCTGNRTRWTTT